VEWLVVLLKKLVFTSIILSVVEILVPEGSVKSYYQYIASLILLTVVFGSFTSIPYERAFSYAEKSEVFEKRESDFLEKMNRHQEDFFTKRIQEGIEQEILEALKRDFGLEEESVEVEVSSSYDKEAGYTIRILSPSFLGEKEKQEWVKRWAERYKMETHQITFITKTED
jgi:hypothetical protein